MKRYEVKIITTASAVLIVDASDEDEACDMAVDLLTQDDWQFKNVVDIESVEQIDPRE